ncbi:inositol monophosphatase family protein [Candidatus Anaplasma sp. TIGMIC]|uniref:inositol monophosphatase family protein n=1 Tax=Candidatus Anaplasma sp. TIGMIC TaxID=3020713 RepID=UPI00232E92A0|nr:inositol monophosphatase family protein [Candidatus Anaplasma sp. TIGMIC]MDB1135388.1 inositol monophosphatase family protein [Candidatus Anaplasma sp. TIGMIC]
MATLFSPVIGVMLKAVRKSSRGLVRDFNEIKYVKSSYTAASEFTRAAYSRSSRIIAEELSEYKQGLEILFEGMRETKDLGDMFWFVSTIDSRTNFMSGLPYFATAIALVKGGEVVAAIVDSPILRETYYAEKGYGSFVECGQSRYSKMYVTRKESINAAVFDYTAGCANVRGIIEVLASNHIVLRSMGSVVLGFSYLCAGGCDVLIYSGVQEHKAGMGKLFVEESKGSITVQDGILIASNFFLRDYVEKQIAAAQK